MQATLQDICKVIDAIVHVEGDLSRLVEKVAVGDLLSFVMGSDADGAAWITIQTHLNVAAVAVLKDIPIIVIASGREPAADLAARCREEGIAVASTPYSIFDACVRLGQLGLIG